MVHALAALLLLGLNSAATQATAPPNPMPPATFKVTVPQSPQGAGPGKDGKLHLVELVFHPPALVTGAINASLYDSTRRNNTPAGEGKVQLLNATMAFTSNFFSIDADHIFGQVCIGMVCIPSAPRDHTYLNCFVSIATPRSLIDTETSSLFVFNIKRVASRAPTPGPVVRRRIRRQERAQAQVLLLRLLKGWRAHLGETTDGTALPRVHGAAGLAPHHRHTDGWQRVQATRRPALGARSSGRQHDLCTASFYTYT